MAAVTSMHSFGDALIGLAEHAAFVIVGFVFMVIGLGMGVTIIMLPVGLAIGLLGVAMFVGGLTARISSKT
jgi:hypothetical protein